MCAPSAGSDQSGCSITTAIASIPCSGYTWATRAPFGTPANEAALAPPSSTILPRNALLIRNRLRPIRPPPLQRHRLHGHPRRQRLIAERATREEPALLA